VSPAESLVFVQRKYLDLLAEHQVALGLLTECRDELAVYVDPRDVEDMDRLARIDEAIGRHLSGASVPGGEGMIADPTYIVAEVSQTWTRGAGTPKALLSQQFENVVGVNYARGYALHDFRLSQVMTDADTMHETIVAVFRLEESPEAAEIAALRERVTDLQARVDALIGGAETEGR